MENLGKNDSLKTCPFCHADVQWGFSITQRVQNTTPSGLYVYYQGWCKCGMWKYVPEHESHSHYKHKFSHYSYTIKDVEVVSIN